jgi:hypothetical protein
VYTGVGHVRWPMNQQTLIVMSAILALAVANPEHSGRKNIGAQRQPQRLRGQLQG